LDTELHKLKVVHVAGTKGKVRKSCAARKLLDACFDELIQRS